MMSLRFKTVGALPYVYLLVVLSSLKAAGCRDFTPSADKGEGGRSQSAGGKASTGGSGLESSTGGSSGDGGSAGLGTPEDHGGVGGSANAEAGSAGEAGASPGGAFSDGGSAGVSGACRVDTDCDDHLACNGAERCHLGVCEAGTSEKCEAPLACTERAKIASCEFSSKGPWVTFYGAATIPVTAIGLFGVPSHYATSLVPVELSKAAIDGEGQVVWDNRWSPDGRHLLLNVAGDKRALYEVEFGEGLPSPARLIPNLPRDEGQYSLSDFSSQNDCALAQERDLLFEICVDASGPVAKLVRAGAPDLNLESARFCAGGKAVLVSSLLFDLESANREPEQASDFVVSPDGARLLRYGRETLAGRAERGLTLRGCAVASTSSFISLPALSSSSEGEAGWAPDSRHAMISVGFYPPSELVLVDVDAPADPVVWRASGSDPDTFDYAFSRDSQYVLIQDGSAFSLVSVATGVRTSLSLPEGVTSVEWADDGTTLIIRRELTPGKFTAATWLTAPLGSPELIFQTDVQGVGVAVSVRAGMAIVVPPSEQSVLSRIDLNNLAAGARKLNMSLPIGPLGVPELAPDGSGVLFSNNSADQDTLFWISLLNDSEGQLAWLNKNYALFSGFQPWPR